MEQAAGYWSLCGMQERPHWPAASFFCWYYCNIWAPTVSANCNWTNMDRTVALFCTNCQSLFFFRPIHNLEPKYVGQTGLIQRCKASVATVGLNKHYTGNFTAILGIIKVFLPNVGRALRILRQKVFIICKFLTGILSKIKSYFEGRTTRCWYVYDRWRCSNHCESYEVSL